MVNYILGIALILAGIAFFYKQRNEKSLFVKLCTYLLGIFLIISGGICVHEASQKQKWVEEIERERIERVKSGSEPSFTGGYKKYRCPDGGCLCTKYEKKSTYNSDCKNCDHAKHE